MCAYALSLKLEKKCSSVAVVPIVAVVVVVVVAVVAASKTLGREKEKDGVRWSGLSF